MQESQAIPNWVFTVLQNLALLVGGGIIDRVLTLWLNRKKPQVEVQKLEAETTEITIRARSTAGESLDRMIDRLDRSVAKNEVLRSQRDDLQEKCDKLEMEVESYDRQMKRMKGLLDVHSIKMTELDETK